MSPYRDWAGDFILHQGGLGWAVDWAGLGWAVDWAGLMLIWLSRSWLGSRTANCSPNYLQSRFHHPVMSSWWRPRPHWQHWHCTSRLIVRGPAPASHQCSAVQSTPALDNTFTSTEFVPGYFEAHGITLVISLVREAHKWQWSKRPLCLQFRTWERIEQIFKWEYELALAPQEDPSYVCMKVSHLMLYKNF